MSFLHKSKVREKVNNAVLKALATTGVIATMPIYVTKIDHENFKKSSTEIATIFPGIVFLCHIFTYCFSDINL